MHEIANTVITNISLSIQWFKGSFVFNRKSCYLIGGRQLSASEVVCEVLIRSSFLCKNSSLAATSFSGFGPEDREASVWEEMNLVP